MKNLLQYASPESAGVFSEDVTALISALNRLDQLHSVMIARHDKVIFATTTPVRSGDPFNKNERIKDYNDTLVPVLQGMGIAVNDLFTPVYAHLNEYIRESDLIHLTDAGIAACAALTCDAIRKAAKELQ